MIRDAKPEILNHNIETVPELYETKTKGNLQRSLQLLKKAKVYPKLITKSGIMLGLGENEEQVSK